MSRVIIFLVAMRSILFSLLLLVPSFVHAQQPSHSVPRPPAVAARSYLLFDFNSQQALAAHEPQRRVEPASLTKLMTAYLTFAALLQAGLEGIENGYELPDPMEENLFKLTPDEREERGIISLPQNLGEAIEELAHSDLCRRILGPHIFGRYVELKRKEWDEYRVQITPWEHERYLSIL